MLSAAKQSNYLTLTFLVCQDQLGQSWQPMIRPEIVRVNIFSIQNNYWSNYWTYWTFSFNRTQWLLKHNKIIKSFQVIRRPFKLYSLTDMQLQMNTKLSC